MATTTMSVQFNLAPRERLLWSGIPRQGVMLRPADVYMIPFSLFWAGFAVFWETSVLTQRAPGFFALWGIPFICMGLYITVGRFAYDAWRRARTAYGLTTHRVLISSGGLSPALKSLDLASLPTMALDERPDGTGTITFGAVAQPYGWSRSAWSGSPASPAFESIPGAKGVYDAIRAARDELHSTPTT